MTIDLENNLIDIDGNHLLFLDDKFCDHVHMNNKNGTDYFNIILKDEIYKYIDTSILYETMLYEYDNKTLNFICLTEQIPLNKKIVSCPITNIYKESTYNKKLDETLTSQNDILYMSELFFIEKDGLEDATKILKRNKHNFLTIPFKNKLSYCKFKMIYV